jgi:multimeric flavodoxin WrbA
MEIKVKLLAINGSRRKNGNTDYLIQAILAVAARNGAQIETIFLGDYNIGACSGCEGCASSWDCVIKDDFARIVKMVDEADGIVLASPAYWYTVTSDMKRFIDRCYSFIQFPVSRKAWIGKYQGAGKVCVTAAVCEQAEASAMGNTLSLMNDFARDIGMEVCASVEGRGFFEAGSIKADGNLLQKAEKAGQNLFEQLQR